jgi:chromate reductase
MKVLAISGSLRRDSYNTKLLRAAEELFPPEVDFVLYQGVKEVPPYDEEDDVQPAPMAVAALRSAIGEADAVLFATPEYNSSIPGSLKNALDWVSRPVATNPLRNKPVATRFDENGRLEDESLQEQLQETIEALLAEARVRSFVLA